MTNLPLREARPLIDATIATPGELRGGKVPSLSQNVKLLIDTGARTTCISVEILNNLWLDMVKREVVDTPAGPGELGFYMADVGIFPTDGSGMRRHEVLVGGFLGQTHRYHGLLGRDLLAHYDFRMTACKSFSLTPL